MRLIRKLGFVVSSFGMCISCKCDPEQEVRYAVLEKVTAWPAIASSRDGSCMIGHHVVGDNIHCFVSVGPTGIRCAAMTQFVPGAVMMKLVTPGDVKKHPDKYRVPEYVLDLFAMLRESARRGVAYYDDIAYAVSDNSDERYLECYDENYAISFDKEGGLVVNLLNAKGEFRDEGLDPFRKDLQVIAESFESAIETFKWG